MLYRLWTQFKLIKVNFRKLTFWTLISSDLFFETKRLLQSTEGSKLKGSKVWKDWKLQLKKWHFLTVLCKQVLNLTATINHIFFSITSFQKLLKRMKYQLQRYLQLRRPYFRWGFELNYFIFLKLFEGHQNRKLFWWYHYFISDVINSAYQCSSWNYSEINGLKIIFDACTDGPMLCYGQPTCL